MSDWDKAPLAQPKAAWESAPVFGATAEQKTQASIPMRIVQGIRDPVDAGAQALTHLLPESVVKAGNAANNWIADKTGMVGRLPEGGVDEQLATDEAKYQEARAATGNQGIDWARLTGNVVSPANLAVAAKVPAATTVAGKMAAAIASGGVYGGLTPVNEGGDFATEKAKQIGIGAVAGPVASLAGSAVARVISPQTREAVTKLMKEGITPTPGQILGGRWQVVEDKLQSIPLLGDAIASSRGKGIDELNSAVYKRVLAPIGGKVPSDIGRKGVADVERQVGEYYDNLLPKIQFKADNQFSQDVQTLRDMAQNLPDEQAARFEKILRNQVIGKMTPHGNMSGETLKIIESDLGTMARGLKGDLTFDNRQLGTAIGELQAAIRSNLERANPQFAGELKAANTSWANFVRLRDAASRQGATEGKMTPSQLSSAVRAQDKSAGKGKFAKGDALMQDLSDAGKDVLASKYPDSGSVGRLALGTAVLGGTAAVNPIAAALAASSGAAYLPGGRWLAAKALTARPDGSEAVADLVRRLSPAASPALIGLTQP